MKPIFVFFAAIFLANAAQAQLAIEISGAGANRIPIAVPDFQGDATLTLPMAAVVRRDLEGSGLFKLVAATGQSINDATSIDYALWRQRGADAVITCAANVDADKAETRCRLFDTQKSVQIGAQAFAHTTAQARSAGHRIADFIYEKLTGERGIFSTRIAYVIKNTARYQLQIADADGANAQTALISREPIISPMWSPEGNKLAYVSFESKKPIVYVHDLASGRRQVVANFKGSNSAPAWSPDGKKLAVVLTKDGNSQLYLLNADGSGALRLTNSTGIDTEPQFSPDGASIVFTSDRGGSPQIYRMSVNGGSAERLSFEGNYNVTPRLSPDGKSLAYITRNNGRYQLALMDLGTKQSQILTDSTKDESPSFAPNGRIIMIATEIGGRGVLSTVSIDGRVKQKLSIQAADIREPAWGPFVK